VIDLSVPQTLGGDRYWVRVTLSNYDFITQWQGLPMQIDANIESWYRRDALAIEVQLIC